MAAARSDSLLFERVVGLPRDNRSEFVAVWQDPSNTSVYTNRGERRWNRLVPTAAAPRAVVLPLSEEDTQAARQSENMKKYIQFTAHRNTVST